MKVQSNLIKLSLTGLVIATKLLTSTSISAIENQNSSEVKASGQINPNHYAANVAPDGSITVNRTIDVRVEDIIETNTSLEAPDKIDILFLADNTDSMGPAIANVQENAETLLNLLSSEYNDVQFGVARYYGDPRESVSNYEETGVEQTFTRSFTYLDESKTCLNGQGAAYPCYKYEIKTTVGDKTETAEKFVKEDRHLRFGGDYTKTWTETETNEVESELGAEEAYELQATISDDLNSTLTQINNWSTGSGGNWKEGNFFALHQAATNGSEINGYSTGYNTNWRPDAKRIIVWFGDAESHVKTINEAKTIDALKENNISVVAIHTKSTERSEVQGLDSNEQASTIAYQTNGAYADVYSSELSDTMVSLIGESVAKTTTNTISPAIDLAFGLTGDTEGLDISYSCADALGCSGIKDGDSRSFDMSITVNKAGKYEFQTLENATGAMATNTITAYYAD